MSRLLSKVTIKKVTDILGKTSEETNIMMEALAGKGIFLVTGIIFYYFPLFSIALALAIGGWLICMQFHLSSSIDKSRYMLLTGSAVFVATFAAAFMHYFFIPQLFPPDKVETILFVDGVIVWIIFIPALMGINRYLKIKDRTT